MKPWFESEKIEGAEVSRTSRRAPSGNGARWAKAKYRR
jgi:hypothetical protein